MCRRAGSPSWRVRKGTRRSHPCEVYLAAAELGPVLVDKVERGPDKGAGGVDEVLWPVIFWERSGAK